MPKSLELYRRLLQESLRVAESIEPPTLLAQARVYWQLGNEAQADAIYLELLQRWPYGAGLYLTGSGLLPPDRPHGSSARHLRTAASPAAGRPFRSAADRAPGRSGIG